MEHLGRGISKLALWLFVRIHYDFACKIKNRLKTNKNHRLNRFFSMFTWKLCKLRLEQDLWCLVRLEALAFQAISYDWLYWLWSLNVKRKCFLAVKLLVWLWWQVASLCLHRVTISKQCQMGKRLDERVAVQICIWAVRTDNPLWRSFSIYTSHHPMVSLNN